MREQRVEYIAPASHYRDCCSRQHLADCFTNQQATAVVVALCFKRLRTPSTTITPFGGPPQQERRHTYYEDENRHSLHCQQPIRCKTSRDIIEPNKASQNLSNSLPRHEGDVAADSLPLDGVGEADDGCFGHRRVQHQCTLHLHSSPREVDTCWIREAAIIDGGGDGGGDIVIIVDVAKQQ